MSNVEVAIAILYQNGRFLMQLRDDIPGILYPGCWGFFGGHLEPGETPEFGMRRELMEEIGYCPSELLLFERMETDRGIVRNIFHGALTVEIESLELNEGWDLGLVSVEEIQRGNRYSERAGEVRPLGEPHQKILLAFIEQSQVCKEPTRL